MGYTRVTSFIQLPEGCHCQRVAEVGCQGVPPHRLVKTNTTAVQFSFRKKPETVLGVRVVLRRRTGIPLFSRAHVPRYAQPIVQEVSQACLAGRVTVRSRQTEPPQCFLDIRCNTVSIEIVKRHGLLGDIETLLGRLQAQPCNLC